MTMEDLTHGEEADLDTSQGSNPGESGLVHPLSLTKFTVMYLCTCSLYVFYWYYRSQKCFKQQTGSNASPLLRTLAFLIPGINFLMLHRMLRDDYEALRLQVGGQIFIRQPMVTVWEFAFCFLGLVGFVPGVPAILRLLIFFSYFPIRKLQIVQNLYLAKMTNRLNSDHQFSLVEILVCIVGSVGTLYYIGTAIAGVLERLFGFGGSISY